MIHHAAAAHARRARAVRAPAAAPSGKIDLRKSLGTLYAPSARRVDEVDVPPMRYLTIDGSGDPNTAPAYHEAIEALFAVSYTLKFLVKRRTGTDYGVMPLEGLWWADDMSRFTTHPADKSGWKWTMMIAQPDLVTPEMIDEARRMVVEKKGLAAVGRMRLETVREGRAMQTLHLGPYADEAPTIARVHAAIAAAGGRPTGKHHEIYLGDPRRAAPARLKTIIRQPFA